MIGETSRSRNSVVTDSSKKTDSASRIALSESFTIGTHWCVFMCVWMTFLNQMTLNTFFIHMDMPSLTESRTHTQAERTSKLWILANHYNELMSSYTFLLTQIIWARYILICCVRALMESYAFFRILIEFMPIFWFHLQVYLCVYLSDISRISNYTIRMWFNHLMYEWSFLVQYTMRLQLHNNFKYKFSGA